MQSDFATPEANAHDLKVRSTIEEWLKLYCPKCSQPLKKMDNRISTCKCEKVAILFNLPILTCARVCRVIAQELKILCVQMS